MWGTLCTQVVYVPWRSLITFYHHSWIHHCCNMIWWPGSWLASSSPNSPCTLSSSHSERHRRRKHQSFSSIRSCFHHCATISTLLSKFAVLICNGSELRQSLGLPRHLMHVLLSFILFFYLEFSSEIERLVSSWLSSGRHALKEMNSRNYGWLKARSNGIMIA